MRYAVIAICVHSPDAVPEVNRHLSDNSSIILSRTGIPLKERGVRLISLIVEADTDIIGKISGKIGRIRDVEIKSLVMKQNC
ncbi:MAG: CopG family transcriptional regulator [Spirochaetales bacterium]|nr:CopG family transcriptional regulator [Spirochaetales bacterium]